MQSVLSNVELPRMEYSTKQGYCLPGREMGAWNRAVLAKGMSGSKSSLVWLERVKWQSFKAITSILVLMAISTACVPKYDPAEHVNYQSNIEGEVGGVRIGVRPHYQLSSVYLVPDTQYGRFALSLLKKDKTVDERFAQLIRTGAAEGGVLTIRDLKVGGYIFYCYAEIDADIPTEKVPEFCLLNHRSIKKTYFSAKNANPDDRLEEYYQTPFGDFQRDVNGNWSVDKIRVTHRETCQVSVHVWAGSYALLEIPDVHGDNYPRPFYESYDESKRSEMFWRRFSSQNMGAK